MELLGMEPKEKEIGCQICGTPSHAGHTPSCPIQKQRDENDRFLSETIYSNPNSDAGKRTRERINKFDKFWRASWQDKRDGSREKFETNLEDSPFSKYSSKGWKIHVAFDKGQERSMAFFLYTNGLYFKVEAGSGTYFNGNKESGATIYIGSYDCMKKIVDFIQSKADRILHKCYGSGIDIPVSSKISARFDISKSPLGIRRGDDGKQGNGKYGEMGIVWPDLCGIPTLSKYDQRINFLMSNWKQKSDDQKKRDYQELQRIYKESKEELIKDFGEEFLLGRKT